MNEKRKQIKEEYTASFSFKIKTMEGALESLKQRHAAELKTHEDALESLRIQFEAFDKLKI